MANSRISSIHHRQDLIPKCRKATGFFLDNFLPIQFKWSCRFLRFFGWSIFQDFTWVLSFFHKFLRILQKGSKSLSLLKTYGIKNGVSKGNPRFFPLKIEVLIQFSSYSTQLELPDLKTRNFALVFQGFCLRFEFFRLSFFEMSKKSLTLLDTPNSI